MLTTITSLYDRRADAQAAADQLRERFGQGRFRIIDNNPDEKEKDGFWARIKQAFLPDEDRIVYGEGVRRGGYMLHAEVDEADADGVCAILEQSPSVDLSERERTWRSEGWQPGGGEPGGPGGAVHAHRQPQRTSERYRAYSQDEAGGLTDAGAPTAGTEPSAFSFGRESGGGEAGRILDENRERELSLSETGRGS